MPTFSIGSTAALNTALREFILASDCTVLLRDDSLLPSLLIDIIQRRGQSVLVIAPTEAYADSIKSALVMAFRERSLEPVDYRHNKLTAKGVPWHVKFCPCTEYHICGQHYSVTVMWPDKNVGLVRSVFMTVASERQSVFIYCVQRDVPDTVVQPLVCSDRAVIYPVGDDYKGDDDAS